MGKRRHKDRRKVTVKRRNIAARRNPSVHNKVSSTSTSPELQGIIKQAAAHQRSGHHEQARTMYEMVLQRDPNNAYAHYGLGVCLSRLGHTESGIEHAERAIELQGDYAPYLVSLSDMLFAAVRIDESMAAANKAKAVDPNNVGARCMLANNFERLQQFGEGIRELEEAERIAPKDAYVQALLARLERRNKDYEKARSRLERVLNWGRIEDEYRRRVLFEYASVMDKLGEYDTAYESIDEYGRLTLNTPAAKRYNKQTRPARIDSYQMGITCERMKRWDSDWYGGMRSGPAFLVGFPRSGTTMTEQILAAHPKIVTTDERAFVTTMRSAWARMVGGDDDSGVMFDRLTVEGAKQLRNVYWEAVEQDGVVVREEQIFVDKLPLNIIDIGLINTVFPDARVLVALRDPRDVCLSCLMQDFALNNSMIHFLRLEDTAAFYEKVMGFYLAVRDRLTLERLEIRYEDTVSDLEGQAKRILEFFEVGWNPEVLRFHEKARGKVVSTPSFEAVTQPVHRGAIGRWRNYGKYFEPFLPGLEPFVKAFGYEE